ncbi:MAG: MBL fold metallo-hydrolase [Austwickia sp.]|jgi:cyclase|nr:MBL fold metallo-hydrolase [Austwickia sp.]MBK8435860.1 MBL fold metallo-hydrolase [Austwickia sp.]MBK9101545.1 MBL fold metallo-hydrolase [Austwickia sp.]
MSSHRHPPGSFEPPRQAREVSDGIYAYIQPDGSWWINNTGFLVGRRGVISVDACATQRRTQAYLDTIATVTDQPVRTLVNTHHHGDHTFGNYLFPTATIVGYEGIREGIAAWGAPRDLPLWTPVDWGDIELEPPFLTFTETIKLYVDDLETQVQYIGTPAHTTNDSVLWVPDRRVLFSGDVIFNGGTPFLVQGSVSGMLVALARIRELNPEVIVPGHGPVTDPAIVERLEGYVRFVQDVAARGRAAGLTPLETAREVDLGEYADLLDSERIVGNLHRAYAELDGLPPGGPINLQAAIADMIAFNGGQPLSCYA